MRFMFDPSAWVVFICSLVRFYLWNNLVLQKGWWTIKENKEGLWHVSFHQKQRRILKEVFFVCLFFFLLWNWGELPNPLTPFLSFSFLVVFCMLLFLQEVKFFLGFWWVCFPLWKFRLAVFHREKQFFWRHKPPIPNKEQHSQKQQRGRVRWYGRKGAPHHSNLSKQKPKQAPR